MRQLRNVFKRILERLKKKPHIANKSCIMFSPNELAISEFIKHNYGALGI